MSDTEQSNCLHLCKNEAQVIAYLTPIISRALEGDHVIVNSEEYQWLKTSLLPSTYRYEQKRDLLVRHPSFHKSRPTSKADPETLALRDVNYRLACFPTRQQWRR